MPIPSTFSALRPADSSAGKSELQARVLDFLRRHHTLTLATDGPAGLWAATVFYVNVALDLYFRSQASTRHAQNLLTNRRVAATISRDAEDWTAITGVQLEGEAALVADAQEHARVHEAFLARFPFVESLWGGDTRSRLLFRVRARRIFFIDHAYANERLELSADELKPKSG
jgi:uncharacterized protein YhbP (UPF0306 family)